MKVRMFQDTSYKTHCDKCDCNFSVLVNGKPKEPITLFVCEFENEKDNGTYCSQCMYDPSYSERLDQILCEI